MTNISIEPTFHTISEVLAMIKTDSLIMSSLPMRRLSINQVITEIQNKERIDILTAPNNYYHNGLVNALIYSFTLPAYAHKIGIEEKSKRRKTIKDLFLFIENELPNPTININIFESGKNELPSNLFILWSNHLLKTTSEKTAWRHLSCTLKILSATLITQHNKISRFPEEIKQQWLTLKSVTPKTPGYEKSPPLSIYLGIPSSKFNEHELYMGMRYGVMWLLKKLQGQRNLLLLSPTVHEILQSTRNISESGYFNEHRWPKQTSFVHSTKASRTMASIILQKTIENPLLLEWQIYQITKLRPVLDGICSDELELLSPELQHILLERFINEDNSIRFRPKGYGVNDKEWKPLFDYLGAPGSSNARLTRPCWWGTDLLIHTGLERLLMTWLLSTERAQPSGIKKLLISDVFIDEVAARSLQISTIKLRRGSNSAAKIKDLEVETQIYNRKDPPFTVYLDWINVEKQAQSYFDCYNVTNMFITPAGHQVNGIIKPNNISNVTNGYLPLKLLSTPGTVWAETFLLESDYSREAQAFIAILANRLTGIHRKSIKKAIAIPPSTIGESLIVKKELANNRADALPQVESESMGHSVMTGLGIYKDGYSAIGVSNIIEPIRSFSRKVGDEKFALAYEIADRLESTKQKINFSELEKLCKVESPSQDQTDLFKILDEQDKLTIAGEIELDGQLIVVETDFTAALMYGYICHLEAALPELMESDRNDTTIRYLSKYFYLKQTFSQFELNTQEAGRTLARKTTFPFPPIN